MAKGENATGQGDGGARSDLLDAGLRAAFGRPKDAEPGDFVPAWLKPFRCEFAVRRRKSPIGSGSE